MEEGSTTATLLSRGEEVIPLRLKADGTLEVSGLLMHTTPLSLPLAVVMFFP